LKVFRRVQVASIGGFVKQYQITLDPNKLLGYNLPITRVVEAIRRSNKEVEGKSSVLGIEYTVRERLHPEPQRSADDSGRDRWRRNPIFLRDVANIQFGPEIRRGVAELMERRGGGGIIVVRFGENVLRVIER